MTLPDWFRSAACASPAAAKIDFQSTKPAQIEAAIEICVECPVMQLCLQWATEERKPGVWGGTTAIERAVMRAESNGEPRRKRGRPQSQIVHGTRTAYAKKGCRCDDCRAAHTNYGRGQRLSKFPDLTRSEREHATQLMASAMVTGPKKHGTVHRYQNLKCRCSECVEGMRERWREKGARRRAREKASR